MLELVGLTSSMLFECKKSRLSDDDHVCKLFAALNFYCAIKDKEIPVTMETSEYSETCPDLSSRIEVTAFPESGATHDKTTKKKMDDVSR